MTDFATRKYFRVTFTPKFPAWDSKPMTLDVRAKSKRDANKIARDRMENSGHIFTHSDAVTISAKEIEASEYSPD